MKSITVRGIDDAMGEKLKKMGREKGISVNQLILDLLKERLGLKKEKKYRAVHDDLDHLFGRWSEEEFQRIQGEDRFWACRRRGALEMKEMEDISRACSQATCAILAHPLKNNFLSFQNSFLHRSGKPGKTGGDVKTGKPGTLPYFASRDRR